MEDLPLKGCWTFSPFSHETNSFVPLPSMGPKATGPGQNLGNLEPKYLFPPSKFISDILSQL
jgi:hypothetical protein